MAPFYLLFPCCRADYALCFYVLHMTLSVTTRCTHKHANGWVSLYLCNVCIVFPRCNALSVYIASKKGSYYQHPLTCVCLFIAGVGACTYLCVYDLIAACTIRESKVSIYCPVNKELSFTLWPLYATISQCQSGWTVTRQIHTLQAVTNKGSGVIDSGK